MPSPLRKARSASNRRQGRKAGRFRSGLRRLVILGCVSVLFGTTFILFSLIDLGDEVHGIRNRRNPFLTRPKLAPLRTHSGAVINTKRLVFTYKTDLLRDSLLVRRSAEEENLRRNVLHTIATYPDAEVDFYDDERCLEEIRKHSEEFGTELARYFEEEPLGKYKSDICRLYILYDKGGIYLDNDLLARFDVRTLLHPQSSFVTCISADAENFFQAFLGVSPKHPVLRLAMQYTLEYYKGDRFLDGDWMGTVILRQAWLDWAREDLGRKHELADLLDVPLVVHDNRKHCTQLFYETRLEEEWFKDVEMQSTENDRCCCNFVVADPVTRKVPFFSRVQGIGPFC